MAMRANAAERAVRRAVEGAIPERERVLLAVSGGRDSMVLLDAALRWRCSAVAGVATFDHGTGPAARVASELVREVARRAGVRVVYGRGRGVRASEAAWREARWSFLRDSAELLDARIATAHTADDQIETVLIRALRGAGPRGLAGLFARSSVIRPLVVVSRAEVAVYAARRGVQFVHDPTNASRRYLRNRVRLDILPALEQVHPGFGAWLLSLSRRAADWRAGVEAFVDTLGVQGTARGVLVPAAALEALPSAALALVWPALAARVGIALDRRGTERLASFTRVGEPRGCVQLAHGHEVIRHARAFEIRVGKGQKLA